MKTLKRILQKRLRNAKKIAVLGIGSELRGDDAAGILIAEELSKSFGDSKKRPRHCKVFIGATAPENLTGEIKKFKPAHLIIVDSAEIGKGAGTIRLIDQDQVTGFSFCTHSLPLKILSDYLIQSIGCEITIIGIQPKHLQFDAPVSREIQRAVAYISNTIKEAIQG